MHGLTCHLCKRFAPTATLFELAATVPEDVANDIGNLAAFTSGHLLAQKEFWFPIDQVTFFLDCPFAAEEMA